MKFKDLENVLEREKEIDLQIESLEIEKRKLYDSVVNKNFSKGDLVIYEDNDPDSKAIFTRTKNGYAYASYINGDGECNIGTSKNFFEHWKKL